MGCERYNNYSHGELLSWVEGNDVFLKACGALSVHVSKAHLPLTFLQAFCIFVAQVINKT